MRRIFETIAHECQETIGNNWKQKTILAHASRKHCFPIAQDFNASVLLMGQVGKTSSLIFFADVSACKEMYGVTPRPDWIELNFGGDKYSYASNIVFSNGVLDPWHPGGVLQNKSNSVIAFVMWGAAHHLDLRHHHESDPLSVKQGRETEMLFITKWIAEKYQKIYRKFV